MSTKHKLGGRITKTPNNLIDVVCCIGDKEYNSLIAFVLLLYARSLSLSRFTQIRCHAFQHVTLTFYKRCNFAEIDRKNIPHVLTSVFYRRWRRPRMFGTNTSY